MIKWIELLVSNCSSGEIKRYLESLDEQTLENWKINFLKAEIKENKTYETTLSLLDIEIVEVIEEIINQSFIEWIKFFDKQR